MLMTQFFTTQFFSMTQFTGDTRIKGTSRHTPLPLG